MKKEDLKKLAEPMEYKTRVGPGGKSLAYIDARQAQDRLDEVCGIEDWKVEYAEHRGELFAGVSIRVDGEWITKWDGGTESNIEKEKGAISDSFKRACVTWGLGRFLYNIKPSQSKTEVPKTKQPNTDEKPSVSLDETCPNCGIVCENIKTGTTKTGKPYEMGNCECGTKFFINRK